jgi:hypothetical protein
MREPLHLPLSIRPLPDAEADPLGKTMSRLTIAFAVLLSLAAPAAAEEKMVVDMSKMTCGELVKLGFQDFAGITMWLSGYYNRAFEAP